MLTSAYNKYPKNSFYRTDIRQVSEKGENSALRYLEGQSLSLLDTA